MSDHVGSMLDDPRPIECISAANDSGVWYRVGVRGTTKIMPYREAGQGGYVPWFGVFCGDEIVERVNASFVAEVIYKERTSE